MIAMSAETAAFYWGPNPDPAKLAEFVKAQQHKTRGPYDDARHHAALFLLREKAKAEGAAAPAAAAQPGGAATPAPAQPASAPAAAVAPQPAASVIAPLGTQRAEAVLAILVAARGLPDAKATAALAALGVDTALIQKAASAAAQLGDKGPGEAILALADVFAAMPLPAAGQSAPAVATTPAAAPAAVPVPAVKIRRRPSEIGPFTDASAKFYWQDADEATLRAFVEKNLDTSLSAFDERRYFAALHLLAMRKAA